LVVDTRRIEGPDQPPFGRHPHAGLVVISYCAAGRDWKSECNVPGQETMTLHAGESLVTVAGRGIMHDERSTSDGSHEMTQIILRLPAASRNVSAWLLKSPVADLGNGILRIFDSAALAPSGVDAEGYHVRLRPGASIELPIAPTHRSGFVFTRSGTVSVGAEFIAEHSVAVLDETGDTLWLEAGPDAPAELLIGLGSPLEEPWAKLLGGNGFVIAQDEASAASLLESYASDPERFGHL
jgi:redox-sensitive bicupin YhaK (pirin superfamily)